jgi:S-adenosylmethionine synthetase
LARDLALREPKYNKTAAYCHFGREPFEENGMKFFSWEQVVDLTTYAAMTGAQVETEVAAKKDAILTKWVD